MQAKHELSKYIYDDNLNKSKTSFKKNVSLI